ncbi:uncharacterized protein EDB93DRAFT_1332144 [Suillus bovinus]|uniref:uncharacterized protein n=1 Tax=Suillus bovinus TaxID=48563 RepID=UPI001B86224C|nr:uncharacterized protein EDB93DRAFT_1332144 [Suillus bovinus]KAG2130166.1 hypothetical protein EDB93DRAFT_1332144 [Suillus bovinus]
MASADIHRAHRHEHCSCGKWTGEVSQHIPRRAGGVLRRLAQETYVIKDVLYFLQTLLADGVVIYRCYVVWQSVRVIIVPAMLWCSAAVTGTYGLYNSSQFQSSTTPFLREIARWIKAFLVSTIATNVLSTGLLAYRIWTIEREVARTRASRKGTMMPIVHVLVDAAILYSVALIAVLICFLCSNNGVYIVVDMVVPIISIAFYMVLIRVAISRHRSHLLTVGAITETEYIGNMQQYPMQPLQVQLPQFAPNTSACEVGNVQSGALAK